MPRIWLFGDNIDTDQMAPGEHMKGGIEALAAHCLEGVRPEFPTTVEPGDIVIGGRNFGVGSSREQAAEALRHLGVSAVIALSFAGIFYRNALNLGLPALVISTLDGVVGETRDRCDRRDDEASSGAQQPSDLGDRGLLVVVPVERLGAGDHIQAAIGQRQ